MNSLKTAVVMSVLTLTACSTVKPVVLPPTEIPREKPHEAMVPCNTLPTLPSNVPQMTAEDALRALLENKVSADQTFRDCAARHESLRSWIIDD